MIQIVDVFMRVMKDRVDLSSVIGLVIVDYLSLKLF